jgi:hypothetical protein
MSLTELGELSDEEFELFSFDTGIHPHELLMAIRSAAEKEEHMSIERGSWSPDAALAKRIESGPEYLPEMQAELLPLGICDELILTLEDSAEGLKLLRRLEEYFLNTESICRWLYSYIWGLRGKSLADAVLAGDFRTVHGALEGIDSGTFV